MELSRAIGQSHAQGAGRDSEELVDVTVGLKNRLKDLEDGRRSESYTGNHSSLLDCNTDKSVKVPVAPLWRRCLGLDLCSLAASRVLTGIVILYEARTLDWWNMRAFLSDEGVWPRYLAVMNTDEKVFQLHFILGTVWWVAFLHLVMVCSALFLIVGWNTRYACFGCWIVRQSIMNRCHLINHSFDQQLVVVLLCGVLGQPWAAKFSVDNALLNHGKLDLSPSSSVVSDTTFLLVFHATTMYLFAAWHKYDPCWQDGSVIFLTAGIHAISRPIGQHLLQYSLIVKMLTFAGMTIRYVEVLGPLAYLSPWKYAKLVGIAGLTCMHAGIGIFLRLNDIPFINMCALVALLPSVWWDMLLWAWFRCLPFYLATFPQHALHGLCGWLCRQGFAIPGPPRPMQSETPARAKLVQRFQKCGRWTRLLLSGFVIIYLGWHSIQVYCGGAAQEPCKYRWWTLPPLWTDIGAKLNLNGNWKVFSPRPLSNDFWLVFPAVLENNQTVDVISATFGDFALKPIDYHEPDIFEKPFSFVIKDERWYKFFEFTFVSGEGAWGAERMKELRRHLGVFICREWNKLNGKGPHRLKSFRMQYMDHGIHWDLPERGQSRIWNGEGATKYEQTCEPPAK